MFGTSGTTGCRVFVLFGFVYSVLSSVGCVCLFVYPWYFHRGTGEVSVGGLCLCLEKWWVNMPECLVCCYIMYLSKFHKGWVM